MNEDTSVVENFIIDHEILEQLCNFVNGMHWLERLETYLENVQNSHMVRSELVMPALAKVFRIMRLAMIPNIFTSLTDGFDLFRMVGKVNRELETPFDLGPLIAMLQAAFPINKSRASTNNGGRTSTTTTTTTTTAPALATTSTPPTPIPTSTTTSSPSNLSNLIEAMASSLVSPSTYPSSDVVTVIPRCFINPFSQQPSSQFYPSENTTVDAMASTSSNMASTNAPSSSDTTSGTTPTTAPIATPGNAATTEKSIPELMAELDGLTERVASQLKFQSELLADCRDIYARTMAPLTPSEVAECEAEAVRQVKAEGLKTEFHCTILDQTLKEKRVLMEQNEDLEAQNADLLAKLAAFEQEKNKAKEKAERRRANHAAMIRAKEEKIARLEAKAKAEEDAKAKDGAESEGGSAGNDGLLEVTSPSSSSGTQASGGSSGSSAKAAVEAELEEDDTGADGSGTLSSPGKTGKHRFSKPCAVF